MQHQDKKPRETGNSYISQINNTQVDIAKYLDIVMPVYNLIEYHNNYAKSRKFMAV